MAELADSEAKMAVKQIAECACGRADCQHVKCGGFSQFKNDLPATSASGSLPAARKEGIATYLPSVVIRHCDE